MGKRLAQIATENTEENRRKYRQILFSSGEHLEKRGDSIEFFYTLLFRELSGVGFGNFGVLVRYVDILL